MTNYDEIIILNISILELKVILYYIRLTFT
jgi:hypothetical protein